MRKSLSILTGLIILAAAQIPGAAAAPPKELQPGSTGASVELKNPDGKVVGHAELRQAAQGVLIKAEFDGMPAGRHALHFHEKASCEAPDFESAGEHFNPTNASHGYLANKRHHAGDMPNIDIPESGKATIELLNPMVTLAEGRKNSLLGNDGTSLVVHQGVDDYESQPAGDAGGRIACGAIKKAASGDEATARSASTAK